MFLLSKIALTSSRVRPAGVRPFSASSVRAITNPPLDRDWVSTPNNQAVRNGLRITRITQGMAKGEGLALTPWKVRAYSHLSSSTNKFTQAFSSNAARSRLRTPVLTRRTRTRTKPRLTPRSPTSKTSIAPRLRQRRHTKWIARTRRYSAPTRRCPVNTPVQAQKQRSTRRYVSFSMRIALCNSSLPRPVCVQVEGGTYDVPPSAGPEKDQKSRYGSTERYYDEHASGSKVSKPDEGPEGASAGGRKPEGR